MADWYTREEEVQPSGRVYVSCAATTAVVRSAWPKAGTGKPGQPA